MALLTKFLDPSFETLLIGGAIGENEESSDHILEKYGLKPTIIEEMEREINFKQDRAAYRRIAELIKTYQPHVVHTHASKAGALGRLAAHNLKVPVIVHTFHGHVFHSYFGQAKTLFYKTVERYLAQRSSAIIAISDVQKKELTEQHKICPAEKTHVIPLGFDLSKFQDGKAEKRLDFRAKYALDDDEIAIGIVGRLVPIKNHHLFIDAFADVLAKTDKKIRAFIIGDGESMSTLQQYATEKGLSLALPNETGKKADLTFTSWVKNVDWAYAGTDIVALTSRNEGTPVSLIEAQAANKPIVSTNVGGVADVTMENKTSLLSASDDTKAFTQNLLKLVEDGDLRAEMSQLGWDFVRHRFHYERLVNDVGELYLKLLNQ